MKDQSSTFTFDELVIFHEAGIQYGQPEINSASSNEFSKWAVTQKFPILSNVIIPDGVYPTHLFQFYQDENTGLGVDISHYQYKGNSPLSYEEKFPQNIGDCPFEETVPVPAKKTKSYSELTAYYITKCHLLEALINKSISRKAVLTGDSAEEQQLDYVMPAYMLN